MPLNPWCIDINDLRDAEGDAGEAGRHKGAGTSIRVRSKGRRSYLLHFEQPEAGEWSKVAKRLR